MTSNAKDKVGEGFKKVGKEVKERAIKAVKAAEERTKWVVGKEAKERARKAAKAAEEGTRKAAKAAEEGTRKAAKAAEEGARKAAKVAEEGARKVGKEAKEGARKAAKAAEEGARKVGKAAEEGARKVGKAAEERAGRVKSLWDSLDPNIRDGAKRAAALGVISGVAAAVVCNFIPDVGGLFGAVVGPVVSTGAGLVYFIYLTKED